MSNLNKLYGVETGKEYYACHKNVLCKEWKKPGDGKK